ncbi:MAG: hypothetical protein A4E53_00712 [Pelotomaculum sp. PtaB.Bin104]|nr:MAG: hypothetical protein A4E53_00712 [Pelotomaculum sp. PtaB.Bin104]
MIFDIKFMKPINLFLRLSFFFVLLIKLRSVTILIDANINNFDERIASIIAGGTLYETIFVLILCIVGFVSTFGISRFKEWSRMILICVFLLFILLNIYNALSIFNLQIRDNIGYNTPQKLDR